MKARNLKRLLAQNPWLWGKIGTPEIQWLHLNHPQEKALDLLCAWAEEHLRYISFRPFEEWILSATTTEDRRVTTSRHCDPYTVCTHHMEWMSVRYTVYAHIEGQKPMSREKGTPWLPDEGKTSVRNVIRSLADWSMEYWVPEEHKPLVIDMVIRTTNQGNDAHGLQAQTIEIFRVPSDFNPYSV